MKNLLLKGSKEPKAVEIMVNTRLISPSFHKGLTNCRKNRTSLYRKSPWRDSGFLNTSERYCINWPIIRKISLLRFVRIMLEKWDTGKKG